MPLSVRPLMPLMVSSDVPMLAATCSVHDLGESQKFARALLDSSQTRPIPGTARLGRTRRGWHWHCFAHG
jgi:hypothetical protein